VRGVVTFHDPASGLLYLEDATGGIELRGVPAIDGLAPGRELRADGHADDSRPIPAVVVNPASLEIGESAALPGGQPLGAAQVRNGQLDGRRVTSEARIFQMKVTTERGHLPWLTLNVVTEAGHLSWLLPWQRSHPLPDHLLHARVRGTGICEAIYNNRGQRIGVLMFVGTLGEIEVLQPPAADPFDRPTRNLAEILRPGLDDPLDRVRVEGVVLSQPQADSHLIHLRTPQGALQAELFEESFAPGDRVAIVGYPMLANKHVVLREGTGRLLGRESPPLPLELDVASLLQAGSDSDLVRIRGTVLRNSLEAARGSLFIESGDHIVEVSLSGAFAHQHRAALADELAAGTMLELTGLAEMRGPTLTTGIVSLNDMRLTVRMPDDIAVLRRPPWWTTGRLLALAGGMGAVLALSVAWVLLLRRRVAAQTVIIGDKIERETRWVERSRIARDIHDDVGSALTQITLLGDFGKRGAAEPARAAEQFERISREAREAVRALDGIVWTVNPKNDTLAVTVSYLCQMAQDLTRDAGIRCRLDVPDDIPDLALGARARHNLLLAVKEAVHNVVKHSGAELMRLHLQCGSDALRLSVCDEGRGFDPAQVSGHRTGLDSMRQRLADSGGAFELSSQPGQGTTVTFILPWPSRKAAAAP
jgi:signal transduction histidine kinase